MKNNNQEPVATTQTFSTRRMVYCAMFAALLCIGAYISIPLPLPGAPHITMINFILFIIALLFEPVDSILIVMIWLILGTVGVPVFIGGKGGLGYLIQPWGAYTWAFPVVAAVLPFIRGRKYNRVWYTICALIGFVLIDVIGMVYLKIMMHYDWLTAFNIGFLPFVPLDALKAVVAAQVVPAFKKVMRTEE